MDIPQGLARAQSLLNTGKSGDAERLYRKILKRAPKHPVASFYLGVVLLQGEKGKEAARYFNTAVKAAPNNPLGHDHLGQALLMAGEVDKALASLGKAVAHWRNYSDQLAPILPVLDPFVREFGYDPG